MNSLFRSGPAWGCYHLPAPPDLPTAPTSGFVVSLCLTTEVSLGQRDGGRGQLPLILPTQSHWREQELGQRPDAFSLWLRGRST